MSRTALATVGGTPTLQYDGIPAVGETPTLQYDGIPAVGSNADAAVGTHPRVRPVGSG
ncbi:MAG: hypothetical protein RMK45_00900 [Armatimonadota bacterium]|nr:hypothetical protein [Armatimonadota bacterium]